MNLAADNVQSLASVKVGATISLTYTVTQRNDCPIAHVRGLKPNRQGSRDGAADASKPILVRFAL